jgi:hypothetical protein
MWWCRGRQQQRHDLVAQLAIGELRAVLVARGHQQREDVAAPLQPAPGPPARDLGVEHPVEAPTGALEGRPRRARSAQDLEQVVAAVEAERALELLGGIEVARVGVGVEAEERPLGDAQRQGASPVVEVETVPG